MLVLHLAAHVFNGMNGGFIVAVGFPLQGKVLHPAAADVVELAEYCAGQLHCVDLCNSPKQKQRQELRLCLYGKRKQNVFQTLLFALFTCCDAAG